MQNGYNFSFVSKFGELRGSSYQKGYDEPSVDDIIDEFVLHCTCNGIDVNLCRLIKCIGLYGYNISDCLNHYIDSITRRERYGISNDAILIKVNCKPDNIWDCSKYAINCEPPKYFIDQLKLSGFVPIEFIGHDPSVKYYAHENDFIKGIIVKSGGNYEI